MKEEKQLPRREFIKSTAVMATAAAAVPAYLAAGCTEKREWPQGKVNVAVIGLSMGFNNFMKCEGENLVALCDADERPMKNRLKELHGEISGQGRAIYLSGLS